MFRPLKLNSWNWQFWGNHTPFQTRFLFIVYKSDEISPLNTHSEFDGFNPDFQTHLKKYRCGLYINSSKYLLNPTKYLHQMKVSWNGVPPVIIQVITLKWVRVETNGSYWGSPILRNPQNCHQTLIYLISFFQFLSTSDTFWGLGHTLAMRWCCGFGTHRGFGGNLGPQNDELMVTWWSSLIGI